MKTKIITIALITITSFANQLMAQETAVLKTRTKSNQCNERTAGYDLKTIKCRVIPTETGCTITFDNVGGVATAKADIGSIKAGLVNAKKGYDYYKSMSSFSVSSTDNSVRRRQHYQSSGMPAGKATFKEFTVTKRCDGKTTKISCPDGECDIPVDDCSNGACDLVCEWSWGVSQQGSSMSSSGTAGFSLEIQDGACTAMAINEKGLPGEKKPNSTATNNPK